MADNILTDDEEKILKVVFSEFIDLDVSVNINTEEISKLKQEISVTGICAICPEITISEKVFCFTGTSSKTTRTEIKIIIEAAGGTFRNSVSKRTDYLVVGNDGNPCWAFACYGRKIEDAVNLRREGHGILIVHENDFWDFFDDLAAGVEDR